MSSILAAIKQDNQIAADWLLYYVDRRHQYYKDKSDLLNSTRVPEVGSRVGVGKPTQQKALCLTSLINDEKWLETVEIMETMLSDKKRLFLSVRREAAYIQGNDRGRPAWVVYVQRRYAEEMVKAYGGTVEKYWVHEETIKKWWRELIELGVRVAIKKGCL